jgi:uncharacterized membrane protein YdfJ with MMPL/SSD domain
MMGIGVGIDYVLLMLTRYRESAARGLSPLAAVVHTVDTAGRASWSPAAPSSSACSGWPPWG